MSEPLNILKQAIKNVPFVKYALGIAGIASAITIIKKLSSNGDQIPLLSILIMLGLMVLLFIFSSFTNSKDKVIKVAGYTLLYCVVVITCVSSVLLISSIFFDKPKPIKQLLNVSNTDIPIPKTGPVSDTMSHSKKPDSGYISPLKLHSDSSTFEQQRSIISKPPPQFPYPTIKGIPIKNLSSRKNLIVSAGGNMLEITPQQLQNKLRVKDPVASCGLQELTLYAQKDSLYVSTVFYNLDNEETMGVIEYNHWKVYEENLLDFNEDKRSLEVLDKKHRVTFSIRFIDDPLNPKIVINGYFANDKSVLTMVDLGIDGHSAFTCFEKSDKNWKEKVNKEVKKIVRLFGHPSPK